MKIVVEVNDMKISTNGDTLITYALGSCLGLTVWDPVAKVGGMLHAMLPTSKIDPTKAKTEIYMFVDTGVPALFKDFYRFGGQKERAIVKVAGCGNPIEDRSVFNIGERNYTVLRKLLWANNILIAGQDVGGPYSRNMILDTATGRVIVQVEGITKEI